MADGELAPVRRTVRNIQQLLARGTDRLLEQHVIRFEQWWRGRT